MRLLSSDCPISVRSAETVVVLFVLLMAAFSAVALCDSEDSSAASSRYTVAFDVGIVGPGAPDTPDSVKTDTSGRLVTSLPHPVCRGYVFEGWYDADGDRVRPGAVFSEDTRLNAQWTRTSAEVLTVSFSANTVGSVTSSVPASVSTTSGGTLVSLPEPESDVLTFEGWYLSAECLPGQKVDASDRYASDTVLYAGWTVAGSSFFTASFVSGLNGLADPEDGITGSDAKLDSMPVLHRGGKVFAGWYTSDGTEVTAATTLSSDVTLYARWADAEKDWAPAVWAILLSAVLVPVAWVMDLRYRPPIAAGRYPTATDGEIRAYQTRRYAEIAEMQARGDALSRRIRILSDRRRLGISEPEEDAELDAARAEMASLGVSIRSAKKKYGREFRRMYGLTSSKVSLFFYEVRVLAPTLKL